MEVLQESRMMIPDCHRRLAMAHADLQQLLVRISRTLFFFKDVTYSEPLHLTARIDVIALLTANIKS